MWWSWHLLGSCPLWTIWHRKRVFLKSGALRFLSWSGRLYWKVGLEEQEWVNSWWNRRLISKVGDLMGSFPLLISSSPEILQATQDQKTTRITSIDHTSHQNIISKQTNSTHHSSKNPSSPTSWILLFQHNNRSIRILNQALVIPIHTNPLGYPEQIPRNHSAYTYSSNPHWDIPKNPQKSRVVVYIVITDTSRMTFPYHTLVFTLSYQIPEQFDFIPDILMPLCLWILPDILPWFLVNLRVWKR